MDISELVDEIIELVYHGSAQSDDPYTQERIVHAGIWDLIEEWGKGIEADLTQKEIDREIANLEDEINNLTDERDALKDRVSVLESEIEA